MALAKLFRAGIWVAGDLPYLVVLWVVYGIFFPAGDTVLAGLLVRYLLLWPSARSPIWAFAALAFATSVAVYILPFYISNAPVLVGIRDGTMGDISAHWGIGLVAGLVAVAGLVIARLVIGKFFKPKQANLNS